MLCRKLRFKNRKSNFRRFGWTQASRVQFNKKGTLLMVSGILKASINKARMGEIIVYECKGEDAGYVRSRISLK